eukprot:5497200-Alexandrium_andersonii.AAC.1
MCIRDRGPSVGAEGAGRPAASGVFRASWSQAPRSALWPPAGPRFSKLRKRPVPGPIRPGRPCRARPWASGSHGKNIVA